MRRTAVFVAMTAVLLLVALVGVAGAQTEGSDLGGKIRWGESIVVNEAHDGDLYVLGGDVTINGDIDGDVVAVVSSLKVDGDVSGDVLALAGGVTILGDVEGDVRVGTGQVNVIGDVGEDLVVGTGVLDLDGNLGGDLVVGAGQLTVDGTVGGDAVGTVGVYQLTGDIMGDERITIDPPDKKEERPGWLRGIGALVGILVVGVALGLLFRRRSEAALEAARTNPWPSLGGGALLFLILAVAPLAILLVAILLLIFFGWLQLGSLVGLVVFIMLGSWVIIGFVFFVLIAFIGPAVAGTWLGRLALPDDAHVLAALGLGALVVVALGLIPAVGWFFTLVAVLFGSGAIVRSMRREPDVSA